jgi:hypothetical protein
MKTNLHIQTNASRSGFGTCHPQVSKRVLAMRSVSGRAKE